MSIGIWKKNIKDNSFSPGGRLIMAAYQSLPSRGTKNEPGAVYLHPVVVYLYSLPRVRAFMFSSMRAAFLGGTSLFTTASVPAKSSSG